MVTMKHTTTNPATEATMNSPLTPDSLELFLSLAGDAGNWSGTPLLPELSAEQKGNLTDLKRKGLLTVEFSDGCPWVFFSHAGAELADLHGIDVSEVY